MATPSRAPAPAGARMRRQPVRSDRPLPAMRPSRRSVPSYAPPVRPLEKQAPVEWSRVAGDEVRFLVPGEELRAGIDLIRDKRAVAQRRIVGIDLRHHANRESC